MDEWMDGWPKEGRKLSIARQCRISVIDQAESPQYQREVWKKITQTTMHRHGKNGMGTAAGQAGPGQCLLYDQIAKMLTPCVLLMTASEASWRVNG